MTRFSMMSALRRRRPYTNSDDNAAKTYAVGFLKRFRLFAIVLCRPDDEEFINYMSTNFEDLDIITGENLLFFSLAQPGVTTEASRLIFSAEEALRDQEKYHVDEDLYLYALTQALKVPLSDFPVILITDSLESNSWYIIHTSRQNIYGDLSALTFLVNRHYIVRRVSIEESLDKIIRDAGRFWYQVDSEIPLCEILAIVESSAATHSDNHEKSAKAQRTRDEVAYRLSYNMSKEARELIALTRILCKENSRVYRNYSNANVARLLSIRPEYLEQDSIYFRDVYDKILHMYDIHKLEDHSVLCSLTHKIFESEIKASILQLMRKYCGIPMPEYYNKWYDKGGSYIVQTQKKQVFLNSYQKGTPRKYKSPTLGETRSAFQILSDDGGWKELCSRFELTKEELDELADLWEKIGLIRNDESHCNRMYLQDYENLTELVNKVLSHFFARMVMIKRNLHQ